MTVTDFDHVSYWGGLRLTLCHVAYEAGGSLVDATRENVLP